MARRTNSSDARLIMVGAVVAAAVLAAVYRLFF